VSWRVTVGGVVRAVSRTELTVVVANDPLLDLIDGEVVAVTVRGPGGETARTQARVTVARLHDDAIPVLVHLALGVYERGDAAVRGVLGAALLLAAGGPDPEALHAAGFPTGGGARHLRFRFATTDAELEAVIRIRTAAYVAAGKRGPAAPAMRDAFDAHAKHLVAWVGPRPVAALRLLPWRPEVGFEHETLVPWSPALPPREETVEVMRACVDPGAAVPRALLGLLQRTAAHIVQLGRRYLLSCATRDNLGLYVRIGCRDTGVRYAHAGLGGAEHTVFVADLRRGFYGVRMPLGSHAVLWQELGTRLRGRGLLTPAVPTDAAVARAVDLLSPAVRAVLGRLPRRHRRAL
jgi:hypothetical protein